MDECVHRRLVLRLLLFLALEICMYMCNKHCKRLVKHGLNASAYTQCTQIKQYPLHRRHDMDWVFITEILGTILVSYIVYVGLTGGQH